MMAIRKIRRAYIDQAKLNFKDFDTIENLWLKILESEDVFPMVYILGQVKKKAYRV